MIGGAWQRARPLDLPLPVLYAMALGQIIKMKLFYNTT